MFIVADKNAAEYVVQKKAKFFSLFSELDTLYFWLAETANV